MKLAKRVLKNSIYNSLSNFIVKIGGFAFTIIIARMLNPELYGIYILATSFGLFLLTFTDLGVNGTMVRYVSDALGKNNTILARSYFRYLLKLKFILAFIPSVLLIFLAKTVAFDAFHKPSLYMPLVAISLFMFAQSFFDYAGGCFQVLQRFEYISIAHVALQGLRLIIVPIFILLGFSVSGAVMGQSISVIAALLVLTYFLVKDHHFLFHGSIIKIDKKEVLKFLSYLTIGSISGVFFGYIDSIMIGLFLPAEQVGYYSAGYNIVFAVAGIISIGGVLFPVFTQMDGMELNNAFQKVFKYSSILAWPSAMGLIFLAKPLINVVYGTNYLPALLPMYILSVLIITSSVDFFSIIFNAKGKPEYPVKVIIISSILNIILNYFLILKFGIVGAAISAVISRCFGIIAMGLLSKEVLNIFPSMDTIFKPFFSSLLMVLFLYLIPKPTTLFLGIVEIIIAATVYFAVLLILKGFKKEDWEYLREIILPR